MSTTPHTSTSCTSMILVCTLPNTLELLAVTDKNEWSTVELKGDLPSGRSRCTLAAYNNKLYLFGGWNRKVCNIIKFALNSESFISMTCMKSIRKRANQYS